MTTATSWSEPQCAGGSGEWEDGTIEGGHDKVVILPINAEPNLSAHYYSSYIADKS